MRLEIREIHVHIHADQSAQMALLESIHTKVGQVMGKVSGLEGRLTAVNEELSKIGSETTALVQQVADLKTQLQDADLPAGAEAALATLEETAKRIDDMVPDPVPTDGGEQPSNG